MKAIILAAGKGTRMKSNMPKVLHTLGGFPMVDHVLQVVNRVGVEDCIVVIGYGGEEIQRYLGNRVRYAIQEQQLGTGHAVMQARPFCTQEDEHVLVLSGDTPLLTEEILRQLIETHRAKDVSATVLTTEIDDPTGYGRILRAGDGEVKIVEEKDATPEEKAIREINTGCYCFRVDDVFSALDRITPDNNQGEYYLTDVIEILQKAGKTVGVSLTNDREAVQGINNRVQLAQGEKVLRHRICQRLMEDGVTIIDPDSCFIDQGVTIGIDTIIHPFTIIQGQSTIGEACEIGPGSRIVNSTLGNRVTVDHSLVLDSRLDDEVKIGPFSYLRPGTQLCKGVKVGDYVEIKNSIIGEGSKVPHLSYVGDSRIGKHVNIGAGTITCNYDGVNKHITVIEDGVFIGSNTNLVAPVTIGAGAKTGAGSTITKDVPKDYLAVERDKQRNFPIHRGK